MFEFSRNQADSVVIRHIYDRDATLSPGALTLLKVRYLGTSHYNHLTSLCLGRYGI